MTPYYLGTTEVSAETAAMVHADREAIMREIPDADLAPVSLVPLERCHLCGRWVERGNIKTPCNRPWCGCGGVA